MGQADAVPLKFDPKLSEAAFSAVFSNFNKMPTADDVTSGVAVDYVGVDDRVRFGD